MELPILEPWYEKETKELIKKLDDVKVPSKKKRYLRARMRWLMKVHPKVRKMVWITDLKKIDKVLILGLFKQGFWRKRQEKEQKKLEMWGLDDL